jgi:hypothetical protein
MKSLKKRARLAGLLYCAWALPQAFAMMYVSSQILVRGDAAATFENLLAKEFLFRISIFSDLVGGIIIVLLALVLYQLFHDVDEFAAKALVVFLIVQVPIVFMLESFNLTALMIAKGEVLKALDPVQAQEWATFFLKLYKYGTVPLEVFWGLWLIPFGRLVYKSGFIPRILGVLLIVAGIAYVTDSFAGLLFPNIRPFIVPYLTACFAAGELPIFFWLLIKGVKD